MSEYNNSESLHNFQSWVEDSAILVDADEIAAWAQENPQPFNRDEYLGLYADTSDGTEEEPYNQLIQNYAKHGLKRVGHQGAVESMGVPSTQLPDWDDIQFLAAQVAKLLLLNEDPVGTEVVIGPNAKKPLTLNIPLFVSDMSFGAHSENEGGK